MRASIALALFACLTGCSGQRRRDPAGDLPPRMVPVSRGAIIDRLVITGDLHATSSEELRVPRTEIWELPIRWLAEDGIAVKAGDRVVEFDSSSFTSSLAQHRLALIEATTAFGLFEDVSTLDIAQKEFELQIQRITLAKAKLKAEVPADLLPGRTAQERRLDLKRAEMGVASAEKALAGARAGVSVERRVKQIEVAKAQRAIDDAERSLGELVLLAPRDGIVVIEEHPWDDRKLQVGDSAQPGWTIASLPDVAQGMEVRAELSDVDDGRVLMGSTGTCTLDAYPADALPCAVKQLMPVANSVGRKSLRRAFPVVLGLDRADPARMRPGMSVKVELRRAPLEGVLVVPRAAVRFDGDTAHVRVASGERAIDLGPCDAQACAVTSGLVEGERVAVGGSP